MKKGEKLFIVDLTSVSFFSKEKLHKIAQDETLYKKTPFLFLVSSYVKNSSLDFAQKNLTYLGKKQNYAWDIYSFEY